MYSCKTHFPRDKTLLLIYENMKMSCCINTTFSVLAYDLSTKVFYIKIMFCSMRSKRLGKIVRQDLSVFDMNSERRRLSMRLFSYLVIEFNRVVSPFVLLKTVNKKEGKYKKKLNENASGREDNWFSKNKYWISFR